MHGPEATAAAEQASEVLFGGDPAEASPEVLAVVAAEVPNARLPTDVLRGEEVDLVPLLVDAGLASSRGDARRALTQGAISVNGERVGPEATLGPAAVRHGRYVVLRKGKRSYAVLVAPEG